MILCNTKMQHDEDCNPLRNLFHIFTSPFSYTQVYI